MKSAHQNWIQCLKGAVVSRLRHGLISIAVLTMLLTSSCAVTQTSIPTKVETGLFSLFLQPLPQETHRLSFTLGALVAHRVDGAEVALTPRQTSFRSDRLSTGQIKLASATLPPGRYKGITLHIESATLHGEQGDVALLPPTEPLQAPYSFTILDKQAEALFLSLSDTRLVTDGVLFTPKFSLWKPERILTNLKGFVSNSASQSLTVFNKRSAQVVGSVWVGKRPMDQALDQSRGWLYVALSGEDAIAVIEISNHEVLGQVHLRAGDEPTELALSANGKTLLALNRRSHSVSIIDTDSLSERGRIRLDTEPSDIVMGQNENIAYAIHSISSTVSVLYLDSLRVRTSSMFETSLLRGAVSDDDTTLFVTTDFSSDLLVIDIASLSVRNKIFVGNGARSIKLDRLNGLLYVGKQDGGIAVVDPRALMAIDSFQLPGAIQALTIDNAESALFALLPEKTRLLKLDLISKRKTGSIEVDVKSHNIAVMGER